MSVWSGRRWSAAVAVHGGWAGSGVLNAGVVDTAGAQQMRAGWMQLAQRWAVDVASASVRGERKCGGLQTQMWRIQESVRGGARGSGAAECVQNNPHFPGQYRAQTKPEGRGCRDQRGSGVCSTAAGSGVRQREFIRGLAHHEAAAPGLRACSGSTPSERGRSSRKGEKPQIYRFMAKYRFPRLPKRPRNSVNNVFSAATQMGRDQGTLH
ncbi:hypothetical protein DFH08DRAFT_811538 [Mycena albidolilacea]|uniref:Uncharacterized protein n=1 Tax=Mycena albidolilacea TaxID=1033008 RepID=A0AAD6ZVI3_9AGAR|nr:hypothetical protein DFH08DRAFT_811538 [Mycena albidolilacea]